MTNTEAFAIAERKAKYGRQNQIVWKDRSGEFHFAPRSATAIKAAMLAVGTKGRFTEIAGKGLKFAITWRIGVQMLRNAKVGC